MKCRALETVDALELRIMRHVQRPHSRDQHAGANTHPVTDRCVPDALGFIPNCFLKASVELQIWSKHVTLDTSLEVVVDFRLARIHAGPFRGRSEGKLVEEGRNITSAARVTLLPPRAADG